MEVQRSDVFGKTSVFTQEIDRSTNALSYDDAFKSFFSRQSILAVLLKCIVPYYADMKPADIEQYIKDSSVSTLNAETLSEEDFAGGSKIIYDVVIQCQVPYQYRDTAVEILFDLEMQRSYNVSKYNLVDRAVYYASRLLSRQSVSGSTYSDLAPVYSAWVCLRGIPRDLQNTVHHIQMMDSNTRSVMPRRSLLNVDLLLLSEDYDWDENDDTVIKFLQAVFKNQMWDEKFNPFVEVKEGMTGELERIRMLEQQYEDEMDFARNEGITEGIEKGIEKGRAEALIDIIRAMFTNNLDVDIISNTTGISTEEIHKILNLE